MRGALLRCFRTQVARKDLYGSGASKSGDFARAGGFAHSFLFYSLYIFIQFRLYIPNSDDKIPNPKKQPNSI